MVFGQNDIGNDLLSWVSLGNKLSLKWKIKKWASEISHWNKIFQEHESDDVLMFKQKVRRIASRHVFMEERFCQIIMDNRLKIVNISILEKHAFSSSLNFLYSSLSHSPWTLISWNLTRVFQIGNCLSLSSFYYLI